MLWTGVIPRANGLPNIGIISRIRQRKYPCIILRPDHGLPSLYSSQSFLIHLFSKECTYNVSIHYDIKFAYRFPIPVTGPIIDPIEFRSRYVAWLQHQLSPESNAVLSSATTPLSAEGQLLGKILVVWAASYGVDEGGVEQPENSFQDVQKRRQRVKHMVEEVVRLIDSLSLLRKPSWDGVRCLLMTLPLTEGEHHQAR
jgi:hypothetical protein